MARKQSGTPTISDVAKASGVGTMTVSRVINGGKKVSVATADRVRAAIAKLGYEPNEAARILKGQSPRAIGLIVPDLADPFFSACAHAVQQTATAHGFLTLLLAAERDPTSETRELKMLNSRNIAGILIVPSNEASVQGLKRLRSEGVPVVMLDRTFPGVDAAEVMVENEAGAQKAVNHFIDHGHRNILCVGYDQQFNSIAQRIEGYEKALTDAGIKPQFAIVEEAAAVPVAVMKRLRSLRPPTALLCLNNVTTTYTLSILQREGIQVPHDVAIIGFDDFELAPLLSVPLTAVRQPAAEIGRTSARLLLEWIRSGASESRSMHSRMILPTELVIRRSCGCAPIPKIGLDAVKRYVSEERNRK